MDPFEPRTLGQFEIAAHLDSGGMADVFLAHQLSQAGLPQLAVIKVLRQRYQDEPEITAMFRDEARIMTRLSHPNVVQVYEHGEADGRPYIAMEYLAGDHLGVLARSARRQGEELSPSLVARIGIQVANALDYIHSVGDAEGQPLHLVHRDISPQNIFVTYEGQVKILDFGIAWSEDRSVATRTGMLKGKLRYMSPEQIQSQPLDNRSDLFSLGIVLWELLAAEKLFKAGSEFETMKRICEVPIPSPADERPDIPVTLEAIVMGLLRRPLEERYQRASELRTALMEFLRTDCPDSPATEIIRQAGHLLGNRQRQKQAAIESLRAKKDLQAYLFNDLDADEEVSSSSRRLRPEPELDQAPGRLDPSLTPPSRAVPTQSAESHDGSLPLPKPPTGGGTPGWLPGVLIGLFILSAGTLTLWGLWPSPSPVSDPKPAGDVVPNPEPAPDPTPVPDPAPLADPEPQPAVDAGTDLKPGAEPGPETAVEPPADAGSDPAAKPPPEDPPIPEPAPEPDPEPEPTVGFLIVKTTPSSKVYMGGRYLGNTPITEMELEPGTYHLTLRNEDQSLRKEITVHIRPGEVSSFQYIF